MLLLVFFSSNIFFAQVSKVDDDEKLFNSFRKEKDFKKGFTSIQEYIRRKKLENDTLNIIKAYYALAYKKRNKDSCLMYLDTSFVFSKQIKNFNFPCHQYWLKGEYYYINREFKKAIDNYIIAKRSALEVNNEKIFYRSTQNIGLLKNRIGDYEEALKIFRNNLFFAKKKNYKEISYTRYLKTIFSLADVFNNLQELDSASFYNNIGLKISKKNENRYLTNLFLLSQGNTLYKKGYYRKAIDTVNMGLKEFSLIGNKPNIAVANYILGSIFDDLGEEEKSITKFRKVDSIFNMTNDLLPRCRSSYNNLIAYYKKKNNYHKQLYYTNQLLRLDSILTDNYKHISKTFYKEHERPKLIAEKKELLKKLNKETKNSDYKTSIYLVVVFVLLTLLLYYYSRKKKMEKRFERLVNTKDKELEKEDLNNTNLEKNLNSINKEIVEHIIVSLENFEANEAFLNKNITLTSLAKSMNTNSTYLSKVVNHTKKMNFTNYINTLKVNYVIERLKQDTQYQKYSIKAIAFEAGFKSSESFSKIFKKTTGLYPSYFIKKLNN